jgi:lipopolysaccharide biosynthesis regulator YciM
MLKEDTGTVEAHLTLGNLFRSRGEVDRAIRIHQSLMESASLTYDQRLLAVQQLGRDYMAAGLYDRAEGMFKQLVDETDFRLSAAAAAANLSGDQRLAVGDRSGRTSG